MFKTNFKRVIGFAWKDFSRNKESNIAAVFVLVLPILLATTLFFFQGIVKFATVQVQDKIDITAYFKTEATEDQILNVKAELLKLSTEVQGVQYVSKEQAMNDFKARHEDNPDFMAALDEVGGNPFLSSLNIKTEDPINYEKITSYLSSGPFAELIDKVDYSQKKDTIQRVYNITSSVNRFGLILSIVLFLIAILVVLNTVKLSIDNSKDEITAMRLVGASPWFVRGPFIIQGIICGLTAFLICLIVTIGAVFFLSDKLDVVIYGFHLSSYFVSHLLTILGIQIGAGVGLGALASFILVRSYLRV